MPSTRSAQASTGGSSRRLSSHVLGPLVVFGLLAVIAAAAAVTLTQRSAAIRTVDARAAAMRDVSAVALRHTGRLGPATAGARAGGVKLRVRPADNPLPGGHSGT